MSVYKSNVFLKWSLSVTRT